MNLRLNVIYIVARCFALGRIHGQYHESEEKSTNDEEYKKISGGMLRRDGMYF